jgi:Xaa-Pro dipeptidase
MLMPMSRPPPPPGPFTAEELCRRRAALVATAGEAGVDVVLAYGAHRVGSAVVWLTTWPVTREAVVVLRGAAPAHLLVGFPNHVPDARRTVMAAGLGDEVGALDGSGPGAVADVLRRSGPACRVGTIGAVPASVRAQVDAWASDVVSLDAEYLRLRTVKSAEELERLGPAAALTDHAAVAMLDAAARGASEREMVAEAEHAYRPLGGSHHVCYVSTTSMSAPDRCVPGQWPGDRRAGPGSAVVFELSAGWGTDYPAQLLRTATVGDGPTPLYRRLHDVAEAVHADVLARIRPGALPADLLQSLSPVEDEGLTLVDDLLHGLAGGYLPPVLSHRVGTVEGLHAEPLRAGMALVVQPNVCTPDLRAGVQTGEMVVVTKGGWRPLHHFPAGIQQLSVPAGDLA